VVIDFTILLRITLRTLAPRPPDLVNLFTLFVFRSPFLPKSQRPPLADPVEMCRLPFFSARCPSIFRGGFFPDPCLGFVKNYFAVPFLQSIGICFTPSVFFLMCSRSKQTAALGNEADLRVFIPFIAFLKLESGVSPGRSSSASSLPSSPVVILPFSSSARHGHLPLPPCPCHCNGRFAPLHVSWHTKLAARLPSVCQTVFTLAPANAEPLFFSLCAFPGLHFFFSHVQDTVFISGTFPPRAA